MKLLRPAIIGFVLGGGISTKVFQYIGQAYETSSVDILSIGMLVGGFLGALIGASFGINLTGGQKPSEAFSDDPYSSQERNSN
jgi:hypothetical protein